MLDLFFRKYAWTANLVLLFAALWFVARTVNTAIGAAIRPRPVVDLSTVPAPAPRPPPPQLDEAKIYALIGQKPPAPAAKSDQEEASPEVRNCSNVSATPTRSSLRAQLVGAVLSDWPESSMASILDLGTHETRVYAVGDRVMGALLISIERLRDDRDPAASGFKVAAILCHEGRKEYVDFDAGGGGAPPPPRPVAGPPGMPPRPAASIDAVRKVTDNRYDIPKKFVDDTLSNLSNVATQARIVPSFKNGVANGFKLFSIQPGSLYSAIGVENGDVIQRINGYEINSPDKALEIYQKLRESSHITIEIDRNGQVIRKEYDITGG